MPVGARSTGEYLSRKRGYLWIVPIRSLPTATRFRHPGRVLPIGSGAAPFNRTEANQGTKPTIVRGQDCFISEQP